MVDEDDDDDDDDAQACRVVLRSIKSFTESFSKMKLGCTSENDPSYLRNRAGGNEMAG